MKWDVAIRKTARRAAPQRFELDVAFRSDVERLVLFGPSGAGKTLTLKAIAGLVRPDAGRIAMAGETLFDAARGIDTPARRRGCGYLFQEYALFPHLTVRQNIAFGLAARLAQSAPRRRRRGGRSLARHARAARARRALSRPALGRPAPARRAGARARRRAARAAARRALRRARRAAAQPPARRAAPSCRRAWRCRSSSSPTTRPTSTRSPTTSSTSTPASRSPRRRNSSRST